jgi:hypothetical protein
VCVWLLGCCLRWCAAPAEWADALMLHTGALRQPRIMAAEAPKKHGGKVLADAYRAAPEIHLRMASLLELIADHGVTKVRTET